MALIKCEECGKEYSDKAPSCPNCGCPTMVSNDQFGNNDEQKSSVFARAIAIVVLIAVGIGVFVAMGIYKTDKAHNNSSEEYDDKKTTEYSYSFLDSDDDENWNLDDDNEDYDDDLERLYGTVYYEDTYKVGEDIPAGKYILFANDSHGYFSINSDSSDSFDSIISNDNFKSNSVVEIKKGEYLKLSGCYAVKDKKKVVIDASGDGMFRVGVDIKAGEYKLVVDGNSGYYAVWKNARHESVDEIISNDNFNKSTYITVSDGQYLELSGCHIKKK